MPIVPVLLPCSQQRDGVVEGADTILAIEGWRGTFSIHAVLLGYFAAFRSGQPDRARSFLDEGTARCNPPAWNYAILRFLRREIDEHGLLALADKGNVKTAFHCYLGLDLLQRGQREAALAHFQWIREQGDLGIYEYQMALAELDRMQGKRAWVEGP